MNCLIVDDDMLAIKAVEACISKTPFLTHVSSCSNAKQAIEVLKDKKIDLIFLDVEMPETTGFELLEQLKTVPQIILVTGKPEYAVDAFEYDVTDFLVKPFDFDRFSKAANRAKHNNEKSKEIQTDENDTDEFFIKKDSKFIRLKYSEILFIEALADYIIIYVEKDGGEKSIERHTILSTMKSIETKLPEEEFFRIHRSYIVRLDRIKSIEDNHVFMADKQLPVSRSNKEALLKKLKLTK
ncbi:MAG: LytR/AlgR family response regulator transcription factor [Bacteroidota bacterium]|jgi:DNA-binding LytR/AlgR family response regulator